jgi:hypothetical protein
MAFGDQLDRAERAMGCFHARIVVAAAARAIRSRADSNCGLLRIAPAGHGGGRR